MSFYRGGKDQYTLNQNTFQLQSRRDKLTTEVDRLFNKGDYTAAGRKQAELEWVSRLLRRR